MIEIKMPRLSDTMQEGAVATWHKQPGDTVAVGDVLVEIETDKAVMEYEAFQAGTLAQILVPEGENADIGTPIALLDDGTDVGDGTGGPAPSAPAAASDQSSERREPTPFGPATTAASGGVNGSANSAAKSGSVNGGSASGVSASEGSANGGSVNGGSVNGGGAYGTARQIASPLVRKLARENHLDLSHVTGSGPGGRIIRADLSGLLATGPAAPGTAAVESAVAESAVSPAGLAVPAAPAAQPPATPTPSGPAPSGSAPSDVAAAESDDVRGTRSVPVSQVRRVIARRLSASAREIPHFYVTAAADAQALMDLRATLNAQLAEAGRPKVSVNDLLVRACALALREQPDVNVSYGGDASGALLVHDRVNIGVAVAAESGLIVPVIRDADTKTVTQLGAEAKRLVALAADRKLTPAQTSGGTFTISNLGMYGVEHFTAIINPPESAILAVGATTREPTVTGDTVEPRYRLRYTLSVDHRVIDGALAAKFLQSLTSLIEHPWMIIA
ncbi:MAG TPA: dihydrolipoamide acetyltransferase family protein [Trebonia sp.]|nr:dihydrolipoamide acetyltransferase family protein [Trebonia sp.]